MADSLDIRQQRWSQLIKEERWAPKMLEKVTEIYGMTTDEIQNYDAEKSIGLKGDNNHCNVVIVNININSPDDQALDKVADFIKRVKGLDNE